MPTIEMTTSGLAEAVERRRRRAQSDAHGWEAVRRLHEEYRGTGDERLRALLVERYQGLARSLANRRSKSPDDRDDLTQVAMLGLLKAIDRFDPGVGVQFTTYAWATVDGELKRHIRDHSWAVGVPRSLQESYLRVAAALDELSNALGRSPTLEEVGQAVGMSVEQVIEAIEVREAGRPLSLDSGLDDGEGRAIELGEDDGLMAGVERRGLLSPLLDRLCERDRRILAYRFEEDLTQSEIAKRVGISQMQVSRLLAQILASLRQWAEEEGTVRPDALL